MDILFSDKPPWKCVEWVTSPPWTVAPLAPEFTAPWRSVIHPEAHASKELIGALDKEHKWELAKKMVNTYELIYTHGDERLPPAISLLQPLSRSYFKMIEILDVLQLFQRTAKSGRKLRTAHIAEGPGGFIQAILQAAEDRQRQVLGAFAMTLRPTNPHVPGWKKAAAFLLKNRQVRIHYGADGTGDVYKLPNQQSFQSLCEPGVNLFTADGGFDFSVDYAQQEQAVFPLLVSSSVVGLQVLRKGGDFILKLFDCETEHTQFLILFLGRHFESWTLYKPAITRPCNSERYFLGRDFRGLSESAKGVCATLQAEVFAIAGGSPRYPSIPGSVFTPKERDYLQRHIESSVEHQIASIRAAIELSKHPDEWYRKWYPLCVKRAYLWCETFRVPYRAVPTKGLVT